MTWHIGHPQVFWGLAALPAVWWSLRGLQRALPPARFAGVALTRHALVAAMLVGVADIGLVQEQPREPMVVYLVDRSESIDARERAWQAETLTRLEAGLSERAERQLVMFAGHTQDVARWNLHDRAELGAITDATQQLPADRASAKATNIHSALLGGFSLAADERAKRIVLLSDGLQTTGDAAQAGNVARLEQIPIYTYLPPSIVTEDVALTKILAPQVIRRQAPASVRIALENSLPRPTRARVVVTGNEDRQLFDQRLDVPPGKHLVEVPVRAEDAGSLLITATVTAEGDKVQANNMRQAGIEVIGPPHVLFVGGSRAQVPYIAQVLQSRQMDVDIHDVSGFPADFSQLLAYDAVVLSDMPRTALDPSQMAMLTTFVEEFGGGLVVVGSGGDLATEAKAQTPLDTILPATLTLDAPQQHETQSRLSLILLVDRSSSMTGQRLGLMKHGAVELVKQLQPTDMLGVIAFDTRPFVVVPLEPVATARHTIVERLVRLRAGGGTHFLPALVEAAAQLNTSGAAIKHLILLSDGNTMDPNSPFYGQFVEECKRDHVTVTTLAIGGMFVNVDLLAYLARETGGMFYQVRDDSELPQLMVSDTQRVLARSPFSEGWFRPVLGQPHEAVRGMAERDLPPLRGYLVLQAKPQATTSLVISSDERERDPLLVHWQAGLGRVTMFASDAESRWSAPWIHWNQYQQFWAQVIGWTMRKASVRELMTRIEFVGGSPMLVVSTPASTQPIDQFEVRLMPQDESAPTSLLLSRVSDTQWRASLEGVKPGLYHAMFLQTGHGQLVGEARRWVDVSSQTLGHAEESAAAAPNTDLLKALAERSGGAVDASADTIVGTNPVQRRVVRWDGWLIPLMVMLFLVDVALRGETML